MALAELLVRIAGDTSSFAKSMKDVNSGLENNKSLFAGWSSSLARSVSSALPALSAGAIGKFIFDAANNFEDASRRIQYATGATGAKLESLQQSFKHVYAQSPADAQDVVSAMTVISQRSGLAGAALESLSVKMLKVAKITQTDIKAIAPMFTEMFTAWGIAADKQAASMESLLALSQRTAVPLDRLLERLTKFDDPLRELGFGFQQSAVMLAQFEAAGVEVENVLSGLRKGITTLAKAGEDPSEAFRRIAKQIRDTGNEAEARSLALKTFGKSWLDVYLAIREKRFDDLINGQLQNIAAEVEKGKDVPRSLATEWKLMVHELELVSIPFGESLVWIARSLLKGAKAIGDIFAIVGMKLAEFRANWVGVFGKDGAGLKANLPEIKPLQLPDWNVSKTRVSMVATGERQVTTLAPPSKEEIARQKKVLEDWNKFTSDAIARRTAEWEEYAKDFNATWDKLVSIDTEMVEEMRKSGDEWAARTREAQASVRESSRQMVPVTVGVTDIIRAAWKDTGSDVGESLVRQVEGIDRIRDAYKLFGLTMREDALRELQRMKDSLLDMEQNVWRSVGSVEALAKAMEDLSAAQRKIREKQIEIEGGKPRASSAPSNQSRDTFGSKALREVSTIATDLSRALSDLIWKGGKFKDVMKNAALEIGKALTRFIIQEGLMKIGKMLGGILKDLPGLGGILGKLGGASGAAASALPAGASAAGGVLGSLGGVGKSATQAVSSMASSVVGGLVSGGIAALGSVFSGMMVSRAVKGLQGTLSGMSATQVSLTEQSNLYLPVLRSIHERLMEIRQIGVRVFTTDSAVEVFMRGATPGGITINVNNPNWIGFRDMDVFLDDLARRIKQRL